MAFTKPLVSIKNIVLSLNRRVGHTLDSNYYEDIMVWIEEGLDLIQCYGMLTHQNIEVPVVKRIAKLPCHYELLVGISVGTRRLLPSTNQVAFANDYFNEANSYVLNGNEVIVGDSSVDKITIFYKDFLRDKEGFMLIPSHAAVREYLIAFAMMQLSGTGYPHIKLTYEKLEQKAMLYEARALEAMQNVTLEDLETIKNSIFTLLPLSRNSHKTFFNGMEEGTQVITHYNDML